jgi:hypothetical protein
MGLTLREHPVSFLRPACRRALRSALAVAGQGGQRALASATGETIASHGAVAANVLGLTTQTPLRTIYLTSGRSRTVKVGSQMVELRHAPEWELLLPGHAAGDALRAIAWAGKARAHETVSALRQRLKPAEQQNLLGLRGRLPTWLAHDVSSLANG